MTILEQVQAQLKASSIVYTAPGLTQAILTWQLLLQDAAGVADADVSNEDQWPPLYNILIARLVMREQVAASISNMIGTASSTGQGGLKRVETGPSSAEWFEPLSTVKNVTSTSNSSALPNSDDEICMIAAKLGVYLPFCPKIKKPQVFQVYKPCDNE